MTGKRVIIFGASAALKSELASALRARLDDLGHEVLLLPNPRVLESVKNWKHLEFHWAIFMHSKASKPNELDAWQKTLKALSRQPIFCVLAQDKGAKAFKDKLGADFIFDGTKAPAEEILQSLGLLENTDVKSESYLDGEELNLVELSQKVSKEEGTGLDVGAFLSEDSSPALMPVDSTGEFDMEDEKSEPSIEVHEKKSDDSQFQVSEDSIDELFDVDEAPQEDDQQEESAGIVDLSGDADEAGLEVSNFSENAEDELGSLDGKREEASSLFSEDDEDADGASLLAAAGGDSDVDDGENFMNDFQNELVKHGSDPEEPLEAQEEVEDESEATVIEAAAGDDIDAILGGNPPEQEEQQEEAAESAELPDEEVEFEPGGDFDPTGAGELPAEEASLSSEPEVDPIVGAIPKEDDEKSVQSQLSASAQTKVEPAFEALGDESQDSESADELFGLDQAQAEAASESQSINLDEIKSDLEAMISSDSEQSDDVKTLKRYAALKEREAREKQASLKALRREFDKLMDRLTRSEGERRKLSLSNEELSVQLRASKDKREEANHKLSRVEEQFQERLKDLQLRLDSAQFQSSKAERKLEEFRDRVRNDIQRIRSRERDLANRLELQKRDAEALLAVKDERLLSQKREIDRLEFELDNLKERLMEEVERSELRSQRLDRAVQSLKLAQGMLSGLEEGEFGDSEEDALDGGGTEAA